VTATTVVRPPAGVLGTVNGNVEGMAEVLINEQATVTVNEFVSCVVAPLLLTTLIKTYSDPTTFVFTVTSPLVLIFIKFEFVLG